MQIAALKISPLKLQDIALAPQEENPEIATIQEKDGFFLDAARADDFRIRKVVYDMLRTAQNYLPKGVFFMVFEAYRPPSRQKRLWDAAYKKLAAENPHSTPGQLKTACAHIVADPHDGIGSGHQACCAMDITLCDKYGTEFAMGTAIHELTEQTATGCKTVSAKAKQNRRMLVEALEKAGLLNDPSKWWHFSYGDHQWAWLAGESQALFGPIDI